MITDIRRSQLRIVSVSKIDLPGFVNLRDGGGYPASGGTVATMKLLRSDEPSSWVSADSEFFDKLPLSLVLDLRDAQEIELQPDLFGTDGHFKVKDVPMLGGSISSFADVPGSIADLYLLLVKNSGQMLAEAVNSVADGLKGGSVVVHCTAGKDRTGLVIAFVQSLLGVSEADILDNYSQSEANLAGPWADGMVAKIKALMSSATSSELAAATNLLTTSPKSAMASTLAYIAENHGSVADYLKENGVTDETIAALREELIVK